MERDSISKGKRKIIELKRKSNKQNQYCVIQMLKKHLEGLHQNLLFSASTKHQKILHLYVENTTCPNYLHKFIKKKNQNSTLTYSQSQDYKEEIIKTNIKSSKNFECKVTE